MTTKTKRGYSVVRLDITARPGTWQVANSAGLGLSRSAALSIAQRRVTEERAVVRVLSPGGVVIARTERGQLIVTA